MPQRKVVAQPGSNADLTNHAHHTVQVEGGCWSIRPRLLLGSCPCAALQLGGQTHGHLLQLGALQHLTHHGSETTWQPRLGPRSCLQRHSTMSAITEDVVMLTGRQSCLRPCWLLHDLSLRKRSTGAGTGALTEGMMMMMLLSIAFGHLMTVNGWLIYVCHFHAKCFCLIRLRIATSAFWLPKVQSQGGIGHLGVAGALLIAKTL